MTASTKNKKQILIINTLWTPLENDCTKMLKKSLKLPIEIPTKCNFNIKRTPTLMLFYGWISIPLVNYSNEISTVSTRLFRTSSIFRMLMQIVISLYSLLLVWKLSTSVTSHDLELVITWSCRPLSTSHCSAR